MPRSRLVRLAVIGILSVLIATADNSEKQQQPSVEYVRGKIVRIQVNIEFKADLQLSFPGHPVGDTRAWRDPPQFVLFLGDESDTPLEKCREVYVEESVFSSVEIGDKYQPKTELTKVRPPPRR